MSGPITQGKDFNFFRKLFVTSNTFAHNTNSDADVVFNFRFQVGFSLINEGTSVVQYSFNGNTLHGDMTPGTSSAALFFNHRSVSQIWFRKEDADGYDGYVRVEAWAGF